MKVALWKDYSLLTSGNGYKLERWGSVVLLRPDPQAIWEPSFDMDSYSGLSAKYLRSKTGGGYWEYYKKIPEEWTINYKDLTFKIKPMGFKHTGLFPEQAVNWEETSSLIKNSGRNIKVLNLFAYTGGATVALTRAGAEVCHVDAAKGMVERAKENLKLSNLADKPVRFIVDDCKKFVEREIRRGKKYDAVIMDPPSYGRGPNGEMWKLEDEIFPLVKLCKNVLSDNPLFFLINSYTTGLQPQVIKNVLDIALKDLGGSTEAYEVGLPAEDKTVLPCGCSGLWRSK